MQWQELSTRISLLLENFSELLVSLMFCCTWEPQCCKSQVCLKIILYGIEKNKSVHECLLWQLCLVQPRAVWLCPLEDTLCHCSGAVEQCQLRFSPVFPFTCNYPKWCWMLQPVYKICLKVLQIIWTSCHFCLRSHWWRLAKPLSHGLPPIPTKQLRTWAFLLHWSVGSITWVLKD